MIIISLRPIDIVEPAARALDRRRLARGTRPPGVDAA